MKLNDYLNKKQTYKENYNKIELDVKDNIKSQLKKEKFHFSFKTAVKLCTCLLIIGLVIYINIYLFSPFPTSPKSLSKYEDSEYYEVIEKINVLSFQKPVYKNNAERITKSITRFFKNLFSLKSATGGSDINGAGGNSGTSVPENGSYEEVTDNQVNGIIEGDLYKRTDKYIFYIDESILKVYSIEKENSSLVSQYDLYANIPEFNNSGSFEMYLSKDCSTISILAKYVWTKNTNITTVVNLDISNILDIKYSNKIEISGTYVASRYINEELLIITNVNPMINRLDFDDISTFIPSYTYGGQTIYIDGDKIEIADNASNYHYSVLTKINQKTLEVIDQSAHMSYTSNIYVSENYVYLSNSYNVKSDVYQNNGYNQYNVILCNEISIVDYHDDIEFKGNVSVEGSILNQYSYDEYNGYLRVVTTKEKLYYNDGYGYYYLYKNERNANFYVVSLETFEIVKSILSFAPDGESVRSTRFDKEKAYVCTSIQSQDPVFMFDLSDINNIVIKDTGTIPGFSTSLINLKGGYLLGIGQDENWDPKIEIYKETEDSIISVTKAIFRNAAYSSEYKSYFIDRENNLFGVGYYDYNANTRDQRYRYCLFKFDNELLTVVFNEVIPQSNYDLNRTAYIDGYFYLLSNNTFKVYNLN